MTTRIPVSRLNPDALRASLGNERFLAFRSAGDQARQTLGGRVVLHVNSTATGGGVAEMLPALLGYAAGFGIDVQWRVLSGNPKFFAVTKQLHNLIHGHGDGSALLGPGPRATYEQVQEEAAADIGPELRPGDIAVLHDPQTLGLAPRLRRRGIVVVWRCHIGQDKCDQASAAAWQFLQPYLDDVQLVVFSRANYRPEIVPPDRVRVITPSVDPLAPKNIELSGAATADILSYTGLLEGHPRGPLEFRRRNDTLCRVEHRADVIQLGPPPPRDEPMVVQVSRWDRLKDMRGVMSAFAEHVAALGYGHLILAGPNVTSVTDDPEGAAELNRCIGLWRTLPHNQRQRIHLACLPVKDVDENALIVNALQRHAAVVTQKSLAEGFGLTVLEAMWKARPVVASAVGGILDQITDNEDGLLLSDPSDLDAFGGLIRGVLDNPELATRIGTAAARRAAEFLPDHHLEAWGRLLTEVIAG